MIRITYNMSGLAAVIAGGLVLATSFAEGREDAPKIADRHPDLMIERAFKALPVSVDTRRHVSVPLAKGDRLATRGCGGQTWPNIGYLCLTTGDGSMPRRPSRTVTLERSRTEASSTHHRIAAPQLAQR
jgi:hypothetical protein